MNRIAGIFNFDHETVDPMAIEQMIATLQFRPSDEQGIWIEGVTGLGYTRSGVPQPERDNRQHVPMTSQQAVVVFDGRIDNRRELLAILKPQGIAGRKQVFDEEIVLAAYEKWGQDCPRHLSGDFAFALWNQRNHTLFCARDHFGVKPFYYYRSQSCFVFASTPLALLASRKVPWLIHEERIADLLVEYGGGGLEAVDKSSSFYKNVFRLPPAHTLTVQPGGMQLGRYWELRAAAQVDLKTEEDYIDTFQELFTEAIRCRMQTDTIPAAMLSGGMDSSSIVGLGHKIFEEERGCLLQTFAVISNSTNDIRETPHVFAVLNQGRLQPHLISETELLKRMDDLVKVIEAEAEPFDCLMNLNRLVYMHACDEGISTMLDGVDGDLLLLSSGHLTQLWREFAFRTILEETFAAGGLTAEYKMSRRLFINSLLSAFLPFAPEWLRKLRQPYRTRKAVASAIRNSIINPEFADRAHLDERFTIFNSYRPRTRSFSQIDAHRISLEHPNVPAGLERYGRVASAFGIEARHPLMDVRLAEFCLGLPWQLKTRRGWTKVILRRALEPHLPSNVVWRKDKDSLMWEVNRMILKERADYFYQVTSDELANLKPYIDVPKLMNFWREYLQGADEKHAELLWSGVALAMWLRNQRERSMDTHVGLGWQ